MYSTCLFCTRSLGGNEVLEHFPVGRRLAFDAANGRLWVVCPWCARWNLTPLEQRWEAIEQAERLYRGTRLRVSTDNIGLARLREGLELVRIGRPERPEIAAWRYGDRFGRRRRRQLAIAGGLLAAGVGGAVTAAVLGGGFAALWIGGNLLHSRLRSGPPADRIVARVPRPDGRVLLVRRRHLGLSQFLPSPDGVPVLSVRHVRQDWNGSLEHTEQLSGDDALHAAARLFPAANRYGGTVEDVRTAVARIEHAGSAARYFASLSRTGPRASRIGTITTDWSDGEPRAEGESGLLAMPLSVRLAVEMVVHEEQERRALEGELAALELQWQRAEEIAAIADDLLIPESVRRQLDRLRGR